MLAEPWGRLRAASRWGLAVLLAVGLHGGAGWWALTHPMIAAPPDRAEGITIDLEPVAVPQNAPTPEATAASGAAPVAAAAAAAAEPVREQPAPPEQAAPSEVLPPPPADPPPSEPPPAEPPSPEPPPPEPVPPEQPPAPIPEAVVPPSPPPPEPSPVEMPPPSEETASVPPPPKPEARSEATLEAVAPPPPKPRPKEDPRQAARAAAERRDAAAKRDRARAERLQARAQRQAEQARRQAARAQAERARAAPPQEAGGQGDERAPPRAVSSGASVSTWRGAVIARLNAFKPAPPGGASGTARVSFTVDAGGRVVSASLAASSGDAALDEAAVAMVRRASPVPAPPPELGSRVNLSVPVRFH